MKKLIIKIIHAIKCASIFLLFFISFPIALLLYKHRKIWMISEVDFDARDNGYFFYKFIKEKHPEINSIYLISKKNAKYNAVKSIGDVVEPKSYKHMLLFIASSVRISTLVHGCSPSSYITKYYLTKHHFTGKNVALKHGIFKNVHPNYFKNNAHLDLICCGAKPEYEFISEKFGYNNSEPKYTGLARFDSLFNVKTSNTVLIMPTWRRWLDHVKTIEEFENTDFYKKWASLIKNIDFNNAFYKNELLIRFYVHPKLNKYIQAFEKINKNILFLNSMNGDDIQEQIKEAKVLITDYSSVFFDFAYMKKPAIYYQFDEERYYEKHYEKGYFDYRNDGFGPVCNSESEVINSILTIANDSFNLNEKYCVRVEKFFTLRDNKNCERIFSEIYNLIV